MALLFLGWHKPSSLHNVSSHVWARPAELRCAETEGNPLGKDVFGEVGVFAAEL